MFFFFHQVIQQGMALWPVTQIGFGIHVPAFAPKFKYSEPQDLRKVCCSCKGCNMGRFRLPIRVDLKGSAVQRNQAANLKTDLARWEASTSPGATIKAPL
jgi:hypothetical protein